MIKAALLLGFLVATFLLASVDGQVCSGQLPTSSRVVLLLNQNNLLVFAPNSSDLRLLRVTGVQGKLHSIDVRPQGRTLWGLSNNLQFYRIDLTTGVATYVSDLAQASYTKNLAMDFNPTIDGRLRLISRRLNFGVDVETGSASADGIISYSDGDTNSGNYGKFQGIAYTNSVEGATSTRLYAIDTQSKKKYFLTTQATDVSSGTMSTIGRLDLKGERFGGFDIYTDPSNGCDTAVFAMDGRFWHIDLATAGATQIWRETSDYFGRYLRNLDIWGIAIL